MAAPPLSVGGVQLTVIVPLAPVAEAATAVGSPGTVLGIAVISGEAGP